ncbi:uncharacterized protein LOC141818549 [Curcuma longa]|uniref:uncharacterized protein LOC141818549 n=1 Tax=Curcuma longa TaxID=136217 RepID=UPI003D9E881E
MKISLLHLQKIVLNLDINGGKEKQKAMKVVSSLPGIDSIGIDIKEKKMTVVGSVDAVGLAMKLRRSWHSTDILSITPAKEEEEKKKEEEAIKEEAKQEKQEESKKEEEEEAIDKEMPDNQQMAEEIVNPYKIYYNPYNATQYYYYVASAQDNPNSCTIL